MSSIAALNCLIKNCGARSTVTVLLRYRISQTSIACLHATCFDCTLSPLGLNNDIRILAFRKGWSFSFHFQLPRHNRRNASLHRELKRSVPFWKRCKCAPGNISNIIRTQITDCSTTKHHPRLTIPTDSFSFFRRHSHLWRTRGNRRQSSTIFRKNGDKH